MLALIAAFALGWLAWHPAPPPVAIDGAWVTVSATAYTCAYHPDNPMTSAAGMCEVLANGSRDVMSAGLACPRHWMGRAYRVEGLGVLTCDDTGAHDVWNGLPHVDIRLDTWDDARYWGVQTITIQEVQRE